MSIQFPNDRAKSSKDRYKKAMIIFSKILFSETRDIL